MAAGPLIGGPGTTLPAFAESLLSWSLALACLGVSGYYCLQTAVAAHVLRRWRGHPHPDDDLLPLTTYTREELRRGTPAERCAQFARLLDARFGGGDDDAPRWGDDAVADAMRRDPLLRRLATLAVAGRRKGARRGPTPPGGGGENAAAAATDEERWVAAFRRVWPRVLALPPPSLPSPSSGGGRGAASAADAVDVSVILPARGEDGADLARRLDELDARRGDRRRLAVEYVVVDAGDNRALGSVLSRGRAGGARVRVVTHDGGGGRGPCLNVGARRSRGRVLAFCHADTRLPPGWDESVVRALSADGGGRRLNAYCAFSFGVHAPPRGARPPIGIRAVEVTANLRTRWFSLPYGDQCLSLAASTFHYLGGFPDQCLMEDYELASLLRRRAALLPGVRGYAGPEERLHIVGGEPARCSPRRWQKLGVLCVTWTNSRLVRRYAAGLAADELFRLYYGRPPPRRANALSPWEVQLRDILSKGGRRERRT